MQFFMTSEAFHRLRDATQEHFHLLSEHMYALQKQLGTWLIVGNGLGLFAMTQGAIGGQIATDSWFAAVYLRFAWGIGVAFFAIAATWFFNLYGAFTLSQLSSNFLIVADAAKNFEKEYLPAHVADQIEERTTAALQGIEQKGGEASRNYPIGLAVLTLVHVISGALFVWALIGALNLEIAPLNPHPSSTPR